MNVLKYFSLSILCFLPAIAIELYLQFKYFSSTDVMSLYMNFSGIEELEMFRNIFGIIGFIVFLFISRLRLEYLGKSPKFIFLFFLPFINLIFFIYLLFLEQKFKLTEK